MRWPRNVIAPAVQTGAGRGGPMGGPKPNWARPQVLTRPRKVWCLSPQPKGGEACTSTRTRPRSRRIGGAMARVGATAWARSPLFVAITALLLASAVGISADDDHDGVAPTLLVSLDGFRASYLDAQPEDALPNLNAMWRGGVRASLYPRFISKTFPNHYSIVTGLQEEHHGIVANHMWDPRLRSEFNLASTESEWWNEGEPIWVTASRARITNKVYFWPGSEALIRKHRPDVYFKYDISVTYEHRVDVVSNWVKEAHADVDIDTGKPKPAFMALYFDEPDHTGHVYGPASDEVKAAVRRVDESIGRLRMNVGDGRLERHQRRGRLRPRHGAAVEHARGEPRGRRVWAELHGVVRHRRRRRGAPLAPARSERSIPVGGRRRRMRASTRA